MAMKSAAESRWEKKLGVRTGAGEYEKEDAAHSRYEPTAYSVLERLAASGYIGKDDILVDYGCGKGRVSFFMNYAVGCRTVGVEYSEPLYEAARENLAGYAGRSVKQVEFVCENAENYEIGDATCFYFFNPFSVQILQSALGRIMASYYANPREMKLFFYYATDPYLTCLMTADLLQFLGEIDCRDLFDGGDMREKILVFGLEA